MNEQLISCIDTQPNLSWLLLILGFSYDSTHWVLSYFFKIVIILYFQRLCNKVLQSCKRLVFNK